MSQRATSWLIGVGCLILLSSCAQAVPNEPQRRSDGAPAASAVHAEEPSAGERPLTAASDLCDLIDLDVLRQAIAVPSDTQLTLDSGRTPEEGSIVTCAFDDHDNPRSLYAEVSFRLHDSDAAAAEHFSAETSNGGDCLAAESVFLDDCKAGSGHRGILTFHERWSVATRWRVADLRNLDASTVASLDLAQSLQSAMSTANLDALDSSTSQVGLDAYADVITANVRLSNEPVVGVRIVVSGEGFTAETITNYRGQVRIGVPTTDPYEVWLDEDTLPDGVAVEGDNPLTVAYGAQFFAPANFFFGENLRGSSD